MKVLQNKTIKICKFKVKINNIKRKNWTVFVLNSVVFTVLFKSLYKQEK